MKAIFISVILFCGSLTQRSPAPLASELRRRRWSASGKRPAPCRRNLGFDVHCHVRLGGIGAFSFHLWRHARMPTEPYDQLIEEDLSQYE
jgi:hypothetical protein